MIEKPKQYCRLCDHEIMFGCCIIDTCKCICEMR